MCEYFGTEDVPRDQAGYSLNLKHENVSKLRFDPVSLCNEPVQSSPVQPFPCSLSQAYPEPTASNKQQDCCLSSSPGYMPSHCRQDQSAAARASLLHSTARTKKMRAASASAMRTSGISPTGRAGFAEPSMGAGGTEARGMGGSRRPIEARQGFRPPFASASASTPIPPRAGSRPHRTSKSDAPKQANP